MPSILPAVRPSRLRASLDASVAEGAAAEVFGACAGGAVLTGVVALAAVLGVVGNNAWTAWMGDLVPGPVRGRFLARRMVYLNVAGTVASLAAGCALDAFAPRGWKGETLGVLAAVACVAGIVSIRLMLAQQSPRRRDDTAPDW